MKTTPRGSSKNLSWQVVVLRLLLIVVFAPLVGLCVFMALEFNKSGVHPMAEIAAVCGLLLGIICSLALISSG